ncbi:MAG: hypothetical protein IT424_01775 [Pirellulales bacterium]|nr:hypothetical protein [Pirellulales bacterium]
MSDALTVSATPLTCPACGAEQAAGRTACWLCQAPLFGAGGGAEERPAAPHAAAHAAYSFSISTMLIITTLVAVCSGLLASYPGLGVLVSILLVPVLVRTAKVVRRREAAGAQVPVGQKIALGATSFAATIVIATVVGFATFCCFCATCAAIFGLGSNEPEFLGIALAASLLAAVSILLSVLLFRWSRRRYLRDIETPAETENRN